MITTRNERFTWRDDVHVLPFVVMLILTCLDIGVLTVVKAAMNGGSIESFVYVVYHNGLGTLILLPFFIIHIYRDTGRPPLTFHILFRFFILGLLGLCLFQVLVYVAVSYSSPTMASAISNLMPGTTFLVALLFRMEEIDITSLSSRAKLSGTLLAISGAMVFTFYQGPEIPSPDSPNKLLWSQPSNWVIGGLLLLISTIIRSVWNVLQTATAREYPDQQTIVFFYCLFGTIQCIILSSFLERNPAAWVLQPGLGLSAVVLGAVYSTAFHGNAVTWCLSKKGPVFVAMFAPLSIVIAAITGVIFLGDSLHLGSAIGAMLIAAGFYSVMWGQAKEKNKLMEVMEENFIIGAEHGSFAQNTPLLLSINEPNVQSL